jgi:hypothetical protein
MNNKIKGGTQEEAFIYNSGLLLTIPGQYGNPHL